jgi:hypothetical protein
MTGKRQLSGDDVRTMAKTINVSMAEIAQKADLNPQTFYRKKKDMQFGSKSTRKILEAFEALGWGTTTKAS